MEIEAFIETLNEEIIEDIRNDNCEVIVSFGIENENYVYDLIAQYFQIYDREIISQLFDSIERKVCTCVL